MCETTDEAFERLCRVLDLGNKLDMPAALAVAADKIEHLSGLLLTALALHGGQAFTHSEKEWRASAQRTLGIKQ